MIEFHPLANIFPLIEGVDFDALVADIKVHGLRDKIIMHGGRPLDGRNRWRALAKLGLTDEKILRAHTKPLDAGTDPLAFVISKNLKRRHLDESQRAMVAARLATMRHGENQDPSGKFAARPNVPTQAAAASLLNVGERTVRDARKVIEHGTDELKHAVDRGEVSVSAAAEVATQAVEQQRELVAGGGKEIIAAASTIRAKKRHQKIAKQGMAYIVHTEAPNTSPEQTEAPLSPDPLRDCLETILNAAATVGEGPAPADPAVFERVGKAIDVLYGWWSASALRMIKEMQAVGEAVHDKAAFLKIKTIHNKAAAWEMHSHHAHDSDSERTHREIRLRAARKGGQLLIQMGKSGLRTNGRPAKGTKIGALTDLGTLAQLGTDRKESQGWQRLAKMTEAKFAALLAGKLARPHLPHRKHRERGLRPAA